MTQLRSDAARFANQSYAHVFYDDISVHLPGYVSTSGRGTFKGSITVPKGAIKPLAILSANGVDYQDNTIDTKAYQYWGDIVDGSVELKRVKAGTYRLTIYAEGVFGDYVQDNLTITAGEKTTTSVTWTPESAGTEIFRVGVPDKSAGEYLHGYAGDPDHPLHPPEYRM